MAGDYDLAALRRAEARRQSIIDHLRAHPGASFEALAGAVLAPGAEGEPAMTEMQLRAAMRAMLSKAEIAAAGPARAHAYFAIADQTESAEAARAAFLKRKKAANRERYMAQCEEIRAKQRAQKAAAKASAEPWRTVYREGDNPDIRKNARGQGAVRPRVFINCFQNY